jgi:hypothetical protein
MGVFRTMGGMRPIIVRSYQFVSCRTGTGNLLRPEQQGEHRNHQCA